MKPNINKMAAALLLMAAAATSLSAQTLVPRQDPKKATWGYAVESSEKWSVKPQYETAEAFSQKPNGKSRAFVSKNGKKGLLDENGKVLGAGVVFEEIVPMQGDAMMVTVKGKKGVANYDGVYLVKPEIETVEPLGNEGFIVTVKGKKGLLKNDGNYIISPRYSDIDASVPGFFVVKSGDKAGLITRDGIIKVEPKEFSELTPFKDDYWKVKKGNKAGLINIANQTIVLKPDYDDVIGAYLKGKAFIIKKRDKVEIINSNGKRKAQFPYYLTNEYREIPDKGAIWISTVAGKSYIYLDQYEVASPVTTSVYGIAGFTKNAVSLSRDYNYSERIKTALEPFLRTDKYFSTSSGISPYTDFEKINYKLYCMFKDDGTADLFKTGENKPLGKLVHKLDKTQRVGYLLDSGKICDPDGNLIDTAIYYNGEVKALKNPKTGKFILTDSSLSPKLSKEFESVKVIPDFLSGSGNCNYYVKYENSTWLLDDRGNSITGSEGNQPIRKRLNDDYNNVYYLVITPEGVGIDKVVGLNKYETILKPNYDSFDRLTLWDNGASARYVSDLYVVYKGENVGLFDASQEKMVIPLEKGYTRIGGKAAGYSLEYELHQAGLCYVQAENDATGKERIGLWNFELSKEVLAPSADNEIKSILRGYKGFSNKGKLYNANGTKLAIKPCVDVYESQYANDAPYFFVKLSGLQGRTIEYVITIYNKNGSVYRNRAGQKCVYVFSNTDTPETELEYGSRVTAYVDSDIYLAPYSTLTLEFRLSARDAKTGAAIPVKGDSSRFVTWERKR